MSNVSNDYIEWIGIKEFNILKDIRLEFSSQINIIIGENGVGKTQILKLLYTEFNREKGQEVSNSFCNEFYNKGTQLELLKIVTGRESLFYGGTKLPCTYIPAKEILTHANGFVPMYNKYKEFPFDKTYPTLIEKAQRWTLEEIPEIAKNIIPKLEKILNGTIVIQNNDFYVKKIDGTMVRFDTEAEGLKKIGLIWQLLMNETITSGSALFWDEPEAFINPKFVPDLVEILLELSRNGVQIFVTTHDYIFSKYFGVKSNDGEVLFHSLYKDDNNKVRYESDKTFSGLNHNSIRDTFIQLYEDEIERAME
ncbi:MAG: hypothetical protein ATN35_01880 [Epulopiscium sp. Nele67-Bin004]|nr:MAG: hypothetical protein ATN35_01880 [Epulopiscium sp. Nele67-Bin004]